VWPASAAASTPATPVASSADGISSADATELPTREA
jgi:hypothetical protein